MKEVQLPSGSILEIKDTPFAESKALYQSILEELRGVKLNAQLDHIDFIKDMLCMGFSSKKVEVALNVCLQRCLYNGLKIDKDTFEPVKAREDYSKIYISVIEENITPFLNGLSVELNRLLDLVPGSRT